MFTRAVTRRPGADFAHGLSTAGRGPPDPNLAVRQHAAYVGALRLAGLEVTELPPLAGHPDACFVEDAALVFPGLTVATRPGAPSRRDEVGALSSVLAELGPAAAIRAPSQIW